jgi:hypothetical protein
MVVFPARRTLKGALFLIVALLLTALFGVVVDAEGEALGEAVLAFGLVLAALVVLQTLRPWWHYGVGAEGIEIHRLIGTRLLPRAAIAAVEQVDGARIEQIVAGPQWKGVEAGRAMDLAAGIRARRELGRIVAYVTVPIVLTQTVRGGPLAVRKVGARAPGEFVLVTLVDGTMRALSPSGVAAFVKAWEKSGNP